jgi:hypothetical protein
MRPLLNGDTLGGQEAEHDETTCPLGKEKRIRDAAVP